MTSNRSLWVASIAAIALALVVEVGTLDLGHELTWFGAASPAVAAAVRYVIVGVSIVLIIAAAALRNRGREI